MIKWTWTIKSLVPARDQGDFPGLVGCVYFVLTGKDSDTGRSQALQHSMDLAPPGDKFTPFAELTEKQVRAWLSKHPRAAQFKAIVERALTREDDETHGPVSDGNLPWQTGGAKS